MCIPEFPSPIEQLEKWRACPQAIEWFAAGGFKSFAEAWEVCPNPYWMVWFLSKAGYQGGDKLSQYAAWCVRSTGQPHTIPADAAYAAADAAIQRIQAHQLRIMIPFETIPYWEPKNRGK